MASTYAQRKALGQYGEDIAADFLVAAGMEIIERNYRCPHGEIDIVARDEGTLVVCEVKTRRGRQYGSPLESVTPQKAKRLRRLLGYWLEHHDVPHVGVRIDVVGIVVPAKGRAQVERVQGVS